MGIYTYILNYNLFSPYNVTSMYISPLGTRQSIDVLFLRNGYLSSSFADLPIVLKERKIFLLMVSEDSLQCGGKGMAKQLSQCIKSHTAIHIQWMGKKGVSRTRSHPNNLKLTLVTTTCQQAQLLKAP